MNYKKHYDLLIERARTRQLTGYFERHHIVPRCIGGTDKKSNLVELTPEEHYVAHQLLVKMYPENDSLVYAANKMTVSSKTVKRNNKRYGWLKRRYQSVCKKRIGKKNPSYGRNWYHNPETLENGKFLSKDIPSGWVKGRVPSLQKRHCKVCEKYVDQVSINNRKDVYCDNHRYDFVERNRTNEWHTPAGIFNNPNDAATANNCSRKTVYNRVKSKDFLNYFIIAR
jgi:hypothetical protein